MFFKVKMQFFITLRGNLPKATLFYNASIHPKLAFWKWITYRLIWHYNGPKIIFWLISQNCELKVYTDQSVTIGGKRCTISESGKLKMLNFVNLGWRNPFSDPPKAFFMCHSNLQIESRWIQNNLSWQVAKLFHFLSWKCYIFSSWEGNTPPPSLTLPCDLKSFHKFHHHYTISLKV